MSATNDHFLRIRVGLSPIRLRPAPGTSYTGSLPRDSGPHPFLPTADHSWIAIGSPDGRGLTITEWQTHWDDELIQIDRKTASGWIQIRDWNEILLIPDTS